MDSAASADRNPRVLIAGGGIAGMEALLALHELVGDRVELVMVSADTDFRYRPMAVDEPFSLTPYERRELAPTVAELGARFVKDAVRAVRHEDHVADLAGGEAMPYDVALVCVGATTRPAFAYAFNFLVPGPPLDAGDLIERSQASGPHRIAFVELVVGT